MSSRPRQYQHAESILKRLDEFRYFKTERQRRSAVRGYARMVQRDRGFVNGFAIACALMIYAALTWLLSGLASALSSKWAVRALAAVIAGGVFFVTRRYFQRQYSVEYLRLRLHMVGVPICKKCGYLLEHLASKTPRCPECGWKISPRARGMIKAAEAVRRGSTVEGAEAVPDAQT